MFERSTRTPAEYGTTMVLAVGAVLAAGVAEAVAVDAGNYFELTEFTFENTSGTVAVDRVKQDPYGIDGLFRGVVTAPINEEVICRGTGLLVASMLGLLSGRSGPEAMRTSAWGVGITQAALFALLHNGYLDEAGQIAFKSGFPISPFIGGLFLWNRARQKGIEHAILAHGTANGFIFAMSS